MFIKTNFSDREMRQIVTSDRHDATLFIMYYFIHLINLNFIL